MSNFNNFTFKINILGWWGAFPQPGGATCGVLVTTSEGKFLLDCGGGVLFKYFEHANLTDQFQGVLLSHLHYDHMGDVGCLYYAINYALRVGLHSNKPQVYAPKTPETMWDAVQYTGRRHEDTYCRRKHYLQESQSYDRMLCIPH